MNCRRSNYEVVADILRMETASKTQIMYRAGMSYAQLNKYLDYLIDRGFLLWASDKYPAGIYRTTPQGEVLLDSIDKIQEMLGLDASPKYMYNSDVTPKTTFAEMTAAVKK
jgi:predicted transcriptional regulator